VRVRTYRRRMLKGGWFSHAGDGLKAGWALATRPVESFSGSGASVARHCQVVLTGLVVHKAGVFFFEA